jgi:hypothetical protein
VISRASGFSPGLGRVALHADLVMLALNVV